MSPPPDETFELTHPGGATRLVVGRGVLEHPESHLGPWLDSRQIFLVSSEPVLASCGGVRDVLEQLAGELVVLEVPDGEAAKSLDVARSLWSAMLAAGGRRDSRLVALGGGSVGDVAGFVAATFLRGIDFANLPTTLLAQVDAAIGGKTAIDLPAAKNSVGAFWHPGWVVAEVDLLASLPEWELRAGMAEVVKIAAATDPGLFEFLEREMEAALDGDGARLEELVRAAVAAKIRVVEADPAEDDRRRILNLGHTLAHAIETSLGYRGLRHGEAVAYGLAFALQLAMERGADGEFAHRLGRLLVRLDPPPLPSLDAADLVAAIERDKKARRHGMVWVLPMALGRVEMVDDLEPGRVEAALERFLAAPKIGSSDRRGGVR